MAVDAALLGAVIRSGSAFLRLYRWEPPTLSIGRNQPLANLPTDVPVVRRPTGGQAVWHQDEVTYAVAAPIARFGSLRDSYRAIHARIAAALRRLGADATLAPDAPAPGLGAGACFAAPVGGEVLVEGRKLVGSAQVRRGSAFLQHGSILLAGSQEVVTTLSREPGALKDSLAVAGSRETSVGAALGRPVSFEEVAGAIVDGWPEPTTLTAPDRPSPPLSAPFSDPDWTWRR